MLEKHNDELAQDPFFSSRYSTSRTWPSSASVPRKENRAITLPLYSKWETSFDDLTHALDITQEEIFFMEAKSTFVQIMRSLPQNAAVMRRPLRLDRIAEAAGTLKNDAVMVRKGSDAWSF